MIKTDIYYAQQCTCLMHKAVSIPYYCLVSFKKIRE